MASSSDSIRSATESDQSPRQISTRPLGNIQDFTLSLRSKLQVYEDALVDTVKDEVLVAYDHPVEACAIAATTGLLLLRGPRRFLYRNTLGRFKTEEKLLTAAESQLSVINESFTNLKKANKNMLTKISFGEEDLKRGSTKVRAAGHEIQRLSKYVYKIESQAADLMEDLRAMPGRTALELRAEVASMTSDLKKKRLQLNEMVTKISELGIRV
ncbi:hypothetical protein Cni_G09354 [Canna indica]|uniref:Uncharacterized protein n=1 Tax=Canna indica TaxID=4628 RepID=A0AAQ3K7W6_9LILI|nr:hypothetical protein Cni_G09354 [Canna indica]